MLTILASFAQAESKSASKTNCGGITRLKNCILSSGEKPFSICALQNANPSYSDEIKPLSDAILNIRNSV